MSVSAIGNSDAYARYRQQQLNLLASSGQGTSLPQTTSLSTPLDAASETATTSAFATKFKSDLSSLNGSHHHAHGHGAVPTDATTNATDASSAINPASPAGASDAFSQTMNELASVLNVAAKIASVVV
jgi:hypothetical protein